MKIALNNSSFQSTICRNKSWHSSGGVKILLRLIQVEIACEKALYCHHFLLSTSCDVFKCAHIHSVKLSYLPLELVLYTHTILLREIKLCVFENSPCRGIHFRHMTLIEFNSTENFAPKWFSSIIICWIFSLSPTQSHTRVTQICRHDFARLYSHVKCERDFFEHYLVHDENF